MLSIFFFNCIKVIHSDLVLRNNTPSFTVESVAENLFEIAISLLREITTSTQKKILEVACGVVGMKNYLMFSLKT